MKKVIIALIILISTGVLVATGFVLEKQDAEKLELQIQEGTVKTRDFTQAANRSLPRGGVEFSPRSGEFQILYREETDSFLICIISSPFEEVRQQAEGEFVKTLEISQEKACQLDVSITTPHFANPEHSGEIFGLSFCE